MFYLEDDSEDEEEKVHEGSLRKTEDVYHGKASAGILVSYIHLCPGHFVCSVWGNTERRGENTSTPQKMTNAFSLENVVL